MSNNKGKLTLIALILMIFTSVFGFNNIPRAFSLWDIQQFHGIFLVRYASLFHMHL